MISSRISAGLITATLPKMNYLFTVKFWLCVASHTCHAEWYPLTSGSASCPGLEGRREMTVECGGELRKSLNAGIFACQTGDAKQSPLSPIDS